MIKSILNLFRRRLSVNHVQVQELIVEASQRLNSDKAIRAYNEQLSIRKAVEALKKAQELTGRETLNLRDVYNADEICKSFTVESSGYLIKVDHNPSASFQEAC